MFVSASGAPCCRPSYPRRVVLRLITVLLVAIGTLAPAGLAAASATSLNDAFQAAASEFGVPRDLLVAVAYNESHFDDHQGQPSIDKGYGLMHLVDNPQVRTLAQAAALLGEDPATLQHDDVANIRGGAALLRGYADAEQLNAGTRQDLTRWYGALERYSNSTDPSVARLYADAIYQALNAGITGVSPSGESLAVLPPAALLTPDVAQLDLTTTTSGSGGTSGSSTGTTTGTSSSGTSQSTSSGSSTGLAGSSATNGPDLQYPSTLWVPASANNYDDANRPTGQPINLIIIHVTEGSYTSAINWFQNSTAEVSAHYVVRSSDGQVTQMVPLQDIAWHAGNYSYNQRAIGIEHEGYVDNGTWFTDAMYRSSAMLVRSLCLKYGIPMDRQHIIGHDQVPDPNNPSQFGGADHHTDPGPYWNWDYYMKLVNTTPAAPVNQLANTTFFSATGHNLGPAFGTYWNANGGLPVFGYPRTDSFLEQNADTGQVYTVQYFERQRFELHPENANTPYAVLLGRIGITDAQSRGLINTTPFKSLQSTTQSDSSCTFVAATGHRLCNAFRSYWQSHGLDMGDSGITYRESLALFGYPISDEFTDPQTGYTVQYFERARFEYHPEFKGTQYEVELGLLGNQVLAQRGWIQWP